MNANVTYRKKAGFHRGEVLILLILAVLLLRPRGVLCASEVDPHLEPLRPILGKIWKGVLLSPDGKSQSQVIRIFTLLPSGRVIRVTKKNLDLNQSAEGFIYWNDVSKQLHFFLIGQSGVSLDGKVIMENNVMTIQGTMTWPAPPANPKIRQVYDFRNTFELISETELRDSWYHNAFGPWRPGHVIKFQLSSGDKEFADVTPISISFETKALGESDRAKTLKSVKKVRDIGEQYGTGGLYLIRHFGDGAVLFEQENEKLLKHNWIDQPWRFCTIFSSGERDRQIVGRNWDNQNVGSVLISHYHPPGGYASISFTRAIDMGFPVNLRIDEMADSPFGERLLLAPFYAYDGINDQGLFSGVTGIGSNHVLSGKGRKQIFGSYLIRKILDQCRSVDDVLNLIEGYQPFDLDPGTLSFHVFVAEKSGRTVLLEYEKDSWKQIHRVKPWQVLTNKLMLDTPEAVLMEKCWRYKTASEFLEKRKGRMDWLRAMQLLKEVSQPGTTWSTVYRPQHGELFFTVFQDWKRIYVLTFPED